MSEYVICQRSAQLELRPSDYQVNDYDEIAEVFDRSIGKDFLDVIFSPTLKTIRSILGRRGPIRHLDLACGTGAFICRLNQTLRSESFGIDLSEGQIREAKVKAVKSGIEADFRVGDILSTPFPTDCDLITCNYDSLNHIRNIRDWQYLFKRVRKSLREGGAFLFDVNLPRRLIVDWDYPEVIVKPDLTYVQCGLHLERQQTFVRRKILMQVFSKSDASYTESRALVEHTAVTKGHLFAMLKASGLRETQERIFNSRLRSVHIFMKNRLFVLARG